MKLITKLKLAAVHNLCEAQDRSTEFTIQYMQDVCKVSHETVMNYLSLPEPEKNSLKLIVIQFSEFMNDWMESVDE